MVCTGFWLAKWISALVTGRRSEQMSCGVTYGPVTENQRGKCWPVGSKKNKLRRANDNLNVSRSELSVFAQRKKFTAVELQLLVLLEVVASSRNDRRSRLVGIPNGDVWRQCTQSDRQQCRYSRRRTVTLAESN